MPLCIHIIPMFKIMNSKLAKKILATSFVLASFGPQFVFAATSDSSLFKVSCKPSGDTVPAVGGLIVWEVSSLTPGVTLPEVSLPSLSDPYSFRWIATGSASSSVPDNSLNPFTSFYLTPGRKTVRVTVTRTAGIGKGKSATASCGVTIPQSAAYVSSVSCAPFDILGNPIVPNASIPAGTKVVWKASLAPLSMSTSSYSYRWSGSDNLAGLPGAGDSQTIAYSRPGVKSARVMFSEGIGTKPKSVACVPSVKIGSSSAAASIWEAINAFFGR